MYVRITKAGGHERARPVRSFREGGKVRKRAIANLGRVDEIKRISKKLESLAGGVNGLMGRAENSVPKVDFDAAPAYGNVFALDELRKDPGIDKALDGALRSGRRETDAPAMINAMVSTGPALPAASSLASNGRHGRDSGHVPEGGPAAAAAVDGCADR